MKIERPTPQDIYAVAMRMRASDVREHLAVSFLNSQEELADRLAAAYSRNPASYVAKTDAGEPVAVGGFIFARPNVATLGFFATGDLPAIALDLTRYIKRDLMPRYRTSGVHRFECISIDGHEEAHRWIKMLGMKHEGEFPHFGKGGETFHQFAWTDDYAGASSARH